MLVAIKPETADEYLTRVSKLVIKTQTHFYLDTSFLSWMAKLARSSRSEFLEWVKAVGKSRFHVPVWCAHEFFKHQVDSTLANNFKKEISQFDSAARSFYGFARAFASDELFGGYGAGEQFVRDYQLSIQRLRGMLAIAQDRSTSEIKFGLAEVATFIDEHVLDSPLQRLLVRIEAEERIRNRGRVPPCFQDAHKRGAKNSETSTGEERKSSGGDNSFGDLVVWKEVLHHANKNHGANVVIATNDRKNDWFVNFMQNVDPDLLKESPQIRAVPLPHPWLAREATQTAGVTDLVLIDPPYLGAVLGRLAPKLTAIRRAALDNGLPPVTKDARTDALRWWKHLVPQPPAPVAPVHEAQAETAPTAVAQAQPPATLVLEQRLLDPGLTGCSSEALVVLQKLSTQNEIDREAVLAQLLWDGLDHWTARDLAVLGRMLFDLAEAGDPSVQEKITDFGGQLTFLKPHLSLPLYLGMLARVYVNDDLERRACTASSVEQAVLSLIANPVMADAVSLVGELLQNVDPQPLFIPGNDTTPIKLDCTTVNAADGRSEAELTGIQYKGHDLITDAHTDEDMRFATIFGSPAPIELGRIIDQVARHHLIPSNLIEPDSAYDRRVRFSEFAGIDVD